jgi:hypothetical protein
VALAVPALAAIGATLSSSEGRPGDLIVLTTDNHGNPYVYGGLEFNGPQPVYLVGTADFEKEVARYGVQRCGAPEQRSLGKLAWANGTGSLSFPIPNVPNGDYYFELIVPNASPSCWRIGSGSGPLLLSVRGSAVTASPLPSGAGQPARGVPLWVGVVIAGGLFLVAAVAVVIVTLSRRRR